MGEGGFLKPSVIYSHRRWRWHPNIIVADMGYIEAETKRQLRQTRQIAVVTRIKENMLLVPPFASCEHAACVQGQKLEWLGYEATDQLHWFGVTDPATRCVPGAGKPRTVRVNSVIVPPSTKHCRV